MTNPTLFRETIDILVQAYRDGTLDHAKACACAVGNLITARGHQASGWYADGVCCHRARRPIGGDAQALLDSTGYDIWDISAIEASFERYGAKEDPTGYLGLMAVVDVLIQDIHAGDDEEKETAKARFELEAA